MSVTFESYERRIDQIKPVMEKYGIKDFEDALKICTDKGFNPYDIVKGVSPYIIIGIAIGGLMHGFIPTGFFEAYISKENPFAVPIAVILGIPMYSNAAGVIPVIQVLVAKGVPLGTAIAFMMGVIGLSLPEAMLLKKVMNLKLIAIYFGTIGFFMILSGYFFNMIL